MDKKQIEKIVEAQKEVEGVAKINKSIIGMDEADAIKLITNNSLRARIISRDGQNFILTCDFRMDRINLSIKDGKVIGAKIG